MLDNKETVSSQDTRVEGELQTAFNPKEITLKENYKFYNHNFFFVFFSKIVIILTCFFCFFIARLLWGFKRTGKKNIKGIKGAITISNHCLVQDAFINVPSVFPKKMYVTMLQSNLGFGLASRYLRLCGAVPIPKDRRLLVKFMKNTTAELKKNQFIHIYPEGHLVPYSNHIREFMPGAFHFAYGAEVPIIPIVITFHKPKGIYKWKKKPMIHQNFLEPYYPDYSLPKKECINKMTEDLHKLMSDYFNTHSDKEYVLNEQN